MSASLQRRRQAIAASITFAHFVETSSRFTSDFQANYAAVQFDDHDRAALNRIPDPIDVLAIVEDWCPDVVANLPILARIADDTGKIRLHVVIRDDTSRDLADAYPWEGRSHIPTYVFSDHSGRELGVIVERTPPIRARVQSFLDAFFAAHAEIDPTAFPSGLTEQLKAELVEDSLQLRRDLRDLERSSLVEAIGTLAVGLRPETVTPSTT
jgi:thiol-disulfide isomerase/thioredoxin